MPEHAYPDVVRFLADAATLEDLDAVSAVIAERSTALTQERMRSIEVGQRVKALNVKPARYNGLTGTVAQVARDLTLTPNALVDLDEESTRLLRRHGQDLIPADATTYSVRIPLARLFPL